MNTHFQESHVPQIIYQPFLPVFTSAHHVAAGQCDACSPVVRADSSAPTTPPYADVLYTMNPELGLYLVQDGHYYAALSPSPPAFAVLNTRAYAYLTHFSTPQHMSTIPDIAIGTQTVHDLIALGFLVPANRQAGRATEISSTLAAWLHTTNRCTMRCAYCYLDHTDDDMSLEVGQQAIATTIQTAQRYGYRQVKLKYAGGEPLLRFPFLLHVHDYALHTASQHGITLEEVIISNGTLLTPARVDQIRESGMRLVMSLDGIGAFHDRQRSDVQGKGTSAQVMHAIDLALEHGIVPGVSITVSSQNAAGLPMLVEWLRARQVPFVFNFYREHHNVADPSRLRLQNKQIVNGMLAAYHILERNLPDWSLLDTLADRANIAVPHIHPCSVGRNYLVWHANGQVSKCQMAMDHVVATLRDEDPLALVRSDTSGIQNVAVDTKEACSACAWQYWCAGGCPLETYRATGAYTKQSPHCAIYKRLFSEVVRLEGQRLIHYYSNQH